MKRVLERIGMLVKQRGLSRMQYLLIVIFLLTTLNESILQAKTVRRTIWTGPTTQNDEGGYDIIPIGEVDYQFLEVAEVGDTLIFKYTPKSPGNLVNVALYANYTPHEYELLGENWTSPRNQILLRNNQPAYGSMPNGEGTHEYKIVIDNDSLLARLAYSLFSVAMQNIDLHAIYVTNDDSRLKPEDSGTTTSYVLWENNGSNYVYDSTYNSWNIGSTSIQYSPVENASVGDHLMIDYEITEAGFSSISLWGNEIPYVSQRLFWLGSGLGVDGPPNAWIRPNAGNYTAHLLIRNTDALNMLLYSAFSVGASSNVRIKRIYVDCLNLGGGSVPYLDEDKKEGFEKFSFAYSGKNVANPERGLTYYRDFFSDTPALTADEVRSWRENENITLTHLNFYLKDFMTSDISDEYMDKIRNTFTAIRDGGGKCIVRFAYKKGNQEEDKPWDPEWSVMEGHIDQLKDVLCDNADIIALFEAGFIGAWGEWFYTSNYGDMAPVTIEGFNPRKQVLQKLLDVLPKDRFISVRTPRYKYMLFGANHSAGDVTPDSLAFNQSDYSRIGGHNDAFMSSADGSDKGTFIGPNYLFWQHESLYTPMGGETAWVADMSTVATDYDTTMENLMNYHYSYFNTERNTGFIDAWKANGAWNDIETMLGYRYALSSVQISEHTNADLGEKLFLKFFLANYGFASPYNQHNAHIILIKKNSKRVKYDIAVPLSKFDVRRWTSGEKFMFETEIDIPPTVATGEYYIYLALTDPYPSLENRPEYNIRLIGTDSDGKDIWDARRGWNKLGEASIHGVDGPVKVNDISMSVATKDPRSINVKGGTEPDVEQDVLKTADITFSLRETEGYDRVKFDLYLPEGVGIIQSDMNTCDGAKTAPVLLNGFTNVTIDPNEDGSFHVEVTAPDELTFVDYTPIMTFTLFATDSIDTGDLGIVLVNVKGHHDHLYSPESLGDYAGISTQKVEVTIGSGGYGTLSWPRALKLEDSGIEAYVAQAYVDANNVLLTPIDTIPEKTGVLIKGDAGVHELTVIDDDVPAYAGVNMFLHTAAKKYTTEAADKDELYVLSDKSRGVGFYSVEPNVVIRKYKAYYRKPSSAPARYFLGLSFNQWNIPAAIDTHVKEEESSEGSVYNLLGQCLNDVPSAKGIYIKKGRKYVGR